MRWALQRVVGGSNGELEALMNVCVGGHRLEVMLTARTFVSAAAAAAAARRSGGLDAEAPRAFLMSACNAARVTGKRARLK